MRQVKITHIHLENFKGLRNVELSFDDSETRICGANGVGKTTLFDAYLWLLTGSDSSGSSSFFVQPLDKDGNTIPHIITSVCCSLIIDGSKHDLKRTFEQKWSRNYNDFNRMFFSAFSVDTRDEIVDKMDDFESYIANDITILKCAIMDTIKEESFDMQMALGSIAACGLLCSAASCTWESIYHVRGHEVTNPSLAKCTKLMVKLLKGYYQGTKDYNMNTPATDAAVKSICYKIVQWIDKSEKA